MSGSGSFATSAFYSNLPLYSQSKLTFLRYLYFCDNWAGGCLIWDFNFWVKLTEMFEEQFPGAVLIFLQHFDLPTAQVLLFYERRKFLCKTIGWGWVGQGRTTFIFLLPSKENKRK